MSDRRKTSRETESYVGHHRRHHRRHGPELALTDAGRVDHTEHALLAVTSGTTVEESGVGVIDDLGDCGRKFVSSRRIMQIVLDVQVKLVFCSPVAKGASEVLLQISNCEDLVTVWLFAPHMKRTVSPTDAFTAKGT